MTQTLYAHMNKTKIKKENPSVPRLSGCEFLLYKIIWGKVPAFHFV
jgi:hypothetical protein